jgi:hypothetical protein
VGGLKFRRKSGNFARKRLHMTLSRTKQKMLIL